MSEQFHNPLIDEDGGEEELALPSLEGSLYLAPVEDVILPSVSEAEISIGRTHSSRGFTDSYGDGDSDSEDSDSVGVSPVHNADNEAPSPAVEVTENAVEEEEEGADFVASFTGDVNDLATFYNSPGDPEEDVDSMVTDEVNDYYDAFIGMEEEEDDPFGGYDIDEVLSDAIDMGASDVDILANQPTEFTILGKQVRQNGYPILTDSVILRVQQDIISNVLNEDFISTLELDASYVVRKGHHKGRRLRLSIGKSFGAVFLCFRVISDRIPTLEELNVSDELASWVNLPKGLVLMNGATGTGKALHINSVIPTPLGFRKVREVAKGDVLFDDLGVPCRVIDVHGSADVRHFKVNFASGEQVLAAGNHLWSAAPRGSFSFRTASTEFIYDSLNGGEKWRVPLLLEAVPGNRGILSNVSPSSLGKFMGEGFSSMGDFNNKFSERFAYLGDFEAIAALLPFAPEGFRWAFLRAFFAVSRAVIAEREALEALCAAVRSTAASLGLSSVVERENGSCAVRVFLGGVGVDVLGANEIVSIEEFDDVAADYVCFEVDSPSHLFLCSASFVPTHNSTTLASMLRQVQLTRAQKIVTVEKPIEYRYNHDGLALVVQREIGRDAKTFAKALEGAMRQHPNIILVGEVRNQEEVDALLYAADSGHLAVSTTHATSASASINRIKGFYQGEDLGRVLNSMGELTRGLASQVLLLSTDGKSRFAVREVLSVNDEVAELISAGDVKGIRNYQDEREITMEHELVKAVRMGLATKEEALSKTDRPYRLEAIFNSSFAK